MKLSTYYLLLFFPGVDERVVHSCKILAIGGSATSLLRHCANSTYHKCIISNYTQTLLEFSRQKKPSKFPQNFTCQFKVFIETYEFRNLGCD